MPAVVEWPPTIIEPFSRPPKIKPGIQLSYARSEFKHVGWVEGILSRIRAVYDPPETQHTHQLPAIIWSKIYREENMYYLLQDPLATRPFRLEPLTDYDWLTIDLLNRIFRGQAKPQNPIIMKACMGGHATDFLWTTLMPLLYISDNVVELLRKNEISGWSTFPTDVNDRKRNPLPGYQGFSVTGPVYKRDTSRSKVITKPAPTRTGRPYQVYRGFYLDEQLLDGSDIFLIDAFFIVISQKVQTLFVKNKVSNIRMVPIDEIEIDTFPDKIEQKL